MTTVRTSCVIDAPVQTVWAILREFNGMTVWHPAVQRSDREGDAAPNTPGTIRALTMPDGSVLREQMLSTDDIGRVVTYTILSGSLPVAGYLGTLKAAPDAQDGRTLVEWGAEFAVTSGTEADAAATLRGVYEAGLKGLAEAVRAIA